MTEQAKKLGKETVHNADVPWFYENGKHGGFNKYHGLTKREYFAGLAMQGMCVNAGRNTLSFTKMSELAEKATECADALLEELAKTSEQKEQEALDKAFEESTKPNQEIDDLPF